MDRLIYTAMTGAKHTLGQQAAVADNLANAVTTGFKTEMHKLRAVPVLSSDALYDSRAFVVDASVATDYSSGPMDHTGRALDAAIQGPGWFAVQGSDGTEAYTRDGSFTVSANGILQTRSGQPVLSDAGAPITLPPDSEISIGKDGSISAIPSTGDQNQVTVVARLKLVNPDTASLTRGDDGLFRLSQGGAAAADPNVQVAGGYLEGSNVNVVDQMVTMISLSRQFEMQTKMLQTADTNDQAATKVLQSS